MARVNALRRGFSGIAPLASNASKARKISVDGFASLWEFVSRKRNTAPLADLGQACPEAMEGIASRT